MKVNIRKSTSVYEKYSYLWLIIGTILFVFGNGRWTISLASWVFPIFMIRFMHNQKPLRAFIIVTVVCSIGSYISWQGAMLGSQIIPMIVAVISGLIVTFVFLLDRIIAVKFKGILSTLVFPLAWTTIYYLYSLGPFTTWGSLAYTQYGNLALMQIVSVTGIWGLVFLMTWFASVIYFIWKQKFIWNKIRGAVYLYICIFAIVLLLGGARLTFFPPKSKTVHIASITRPDILSQLTELPGEIHKLPPIEKTIETMETLSVKAASSDTEIVLWQEYGLIMTKADEENLINRGCMVAQKEEIYLLLGIGTFSPDANQLGENKAVLIDPSGKVIWEYLKHHLAPVVESPYFVQGKGEIPVDETPFGKIASAICFDLDSPIFIQQLGKAGVDLLLAPSMGWKQITPLHTHMATFRAIENGFSMVRCTGEGLSIAVDYQGRTLGAVNHYTTDEPVMLSNVPTKGVKTIYSKIGDLFALFCVSSFLAISVLALIRRRQQIEAD